MSVDGERYDSDIIQGIVLPGKLRVFSMWIIMIKRLLIKINKTKKGAAKKGEKLSGEHLISFNLST